MLLALNECPDCCEGDLPPTCMLRWLLCDCERANPSAERILLAREVPAGPPADE